MEIRGDDYCVRYDPTTVTLTCQGLLRLYGAEGYAHIVELFNKVAEQKPATITLNLRELEIVNSPGVNMLSNFVIKLSQTNASQLIIQATHQYPWQDKLVKNLQRLMTELKVEFE